MLILATISDMKRLALVIDLETGEITTTVPVRTEFFDTTIQDRPPCRPFGITWNRDNLFIANNRQLLAFDKQLNFSRKSDTPLQVNTHQLSYNAGRIWAVSPNTNSLIAVPEDTSGQTLEFDLLAHDSHEYNGNDMPPNDVHHFNSILWDDRRLFVAAHGLGHESFINQYDAETLQLITVQRGSGTHIHGLARDEGELFWLSTKTGEIRSDSGFCLPLSRWGYARGLAVTKSHFIVGISELFGRFERHTGDSWVQVIDRRQGDLVNEVWLRESGSLNDLRLLDTQDFAHCADPFWGERAPVSSVDGAIRS